MKNNLIEKVTYLIERDELNKRCRRKEIIYKKCYLMSRLREEQLTFEEIGSYFNQHHASVIHNVQTHKDLTKFRNQDYKNTITEYKVFLVDTKYVVNPRNILDDVKACTSLYKLQRVKRWIDEGRYEYLQEKETEIEN